MNIHRFKNKQIYQIAEQLRKEGIKGLCWSIVDTEKELTIQQIKKRIQTNKKRDALSAFDRHIQTGVLPLISTASSRSSSLYLTYDNFFNITKLERVYRLARRMLAKDKKKMSNERKILAKKITDAMFVTGDFKEHYLYVLYNSSLLRSKTEDEAKLYKNYNPNNAAWKDISAESVYATGSNTHTEIVTLIKKLDPLGAVDPLDSRFRNNELIARVFYLDEWHRRSWRRYSRCMDLFLASLVSYVLTTHNIDTATIRNPYSTTGINIIHNFTINKRRYNLHIYKTKRGELDYSLDDGRITVPHVKFV